MACKVNILKKCQGIYFINILKLFLHFFLNFLLGLRFSYHCCYIILYLSLYYPCPFTLLSLFLHNHIPVLAFSYIRPYINLSLFINLFPSLHLLISDLILSLHSHIPVHTLSYFHAPFSISFIPVLISLSLHPYIHLSHSHTPVIMLFYLVLTFSYVCPYIIESLSHSLIPILTFSYPLPYIRLYPSSYSGTSFLIFLYIRHYILSLYSLISVIVLLLSHQCPHLISVSLLFQIPYLNSSNICPYLTESLSLHSFIRVLTLSYPRPSI